jgi:peptidyl-prolyl cis-trans isomerase SurA
MQLLVPRDTYLVALALVAFLAVPRSAFAQSEAILVNGEPITSYDIDQRTLWLNRTTDFVERMKALISSSEFSQKCPLKRDPPPAQPRSQAEAQEGAERIKKELIACAKRQVLSEGGATTQAVIEALIDDRLKLQAAKQLGIEITDEEVEGYLAERAAKSASMGPDGKKLDLNTFYANFEADGINRKTIQEVIRPQLAWRATIRRKYGPEKGSETEYESFSRRYLQELRQKASPR